MSEAAVIFDMDGVLFDSERAWLLSWQEIAEKHGIEGIERAVYASIGLTEEATRAITQEIMGEGFPLDAYREEAGEVFRTKWQEPGLPVKPGAREILEKLKSLGAGLALATSTKRETARAELEQAGLLQFFDEMAFGDMVSHSKPAPDIFLLAAKLLGRDPASCFVIEDSFNGIRAAKAAGMRAVMVPDLLQPDEEIREAAFRVVPDLFAASALLEPMIGGK